MDKYKNGKIYQITNLTHTKFYIGSTTESLSNRMAKHRNIYMQYLEGKRQTRMSVFELFEEDGPHNCKILLIELFPCNSKEELNAREGTHIINNQCVNKQIAGRTQKQYIAENKDKIREIQRLYRENNKDKVKENKAAYYQKNREKILEQEKVTIICECGCSIIKKLLQKHMKTDKHISIMNNKSDSTNRFFNLK
jgi:hypothetical protein